MVKSYKVEAYSKDMEIVAYCADISSAQKVYEELLNMDEFTAGTVNNTATDYCYATFTKKVTDKDVEIKSWFAL